MRRGEIYWADPDPGVGHEQTGRRPILVVSSNSALEIIPHVVTVIPLTTRERRWSTRIPVTGDNTGLTQPTWAICEQVRTISTQRLRRQLGSTDSLTLANTDRVLRYLLELP